MAPRLPATVDRSFARMIAYKRIVTGVASLLLGLALSFALATHGSPPPAGFLGIAIFGGGGAWMLRDGLRLRRELRAG